MERTQNGGINLPMEPKHTPRPWRGDGTGFIYGQANREEGQAPFVCDVRSQRGSGPCTLQEQANARLIAAAPDLLEACEEGLSFVGGDDPLDRRAWEQMAATFRTVIATATLLPEEH